MATNPATTYWRNLLESEGIEFTYWRDRLAAAVSALAQFDLLDIYHAPPGRAEDPGEPVKPCRMTDNPAPISQHGGAVIIRGAALPLLYRACLALIARRHRDGLAASPLLHEARTTFYRACTSARRHQHGVYSLARKVRLRIDATWRWATAICQAWQ